MDRSSSAKCLLYSDVMKGEPSPTGRGRRSRDEKGNQGVGDIRFTNKYFTPFFYSFLFLNYFTLSLFFYTFFTHDIYAHPHPRPTTSTDDPRPTTFSYTRANAIPQKFCPLCDKQVIASALGQLRINFTCIFKVFPKLPESRILGKL